MKLGYQILSRAAEYEVKQHINARFYAHQDQFQTHVRQECLACKQLQPIDCEDELLL